MPIAAGNAMKRFVPYTAAMTAIVIMIPLPLLGLWLTGNQAPHYFEFPPITRYIQHAPFSWPTFIVMVSGILACCLPPVIRNVRHSVDRNASLAPYRAFPWWGWTAAGFTAFMWIIAWNRFAWAASFQAHTFFPLWLGYIITVSALTAKRKGRCLLTDQPLRMLILFIVSAAFWWYFEYLNRFVQNWYYVGVQKFSPTRYFWFATLPFSTVLPAVLTTDEWLGTFPRIGAGLDHWHRIKLRSPRCIAALWLTLAILGLLGIGNFPNQLFPLLWLAPLMMLTAAQTLAGCPTIFAPLHQGNWKPLFRIALATLMCGFFWELWNSRSLAHWIYAVPYAGRFKLFEMPILGYVGYIPFGLECAVIAHLILRIDPTHSALRANSNGSMVIT